MTIQNYGVLKGRPLDKAIDPPIDPPSDPTPHYHVLLSDTPHPRQVFQIPAR